MRTHVQIHTHRPRYPSYSARKQAWEQGRESQDGQRMSAASLVPSSSSHDLFSSSTIAALARLLLVKRTHAAMRERSDMSSDRSDREWSIASRKALAASSFREIS